MVNNKITLHINGSWKSKPVGKQVSYVSSQILSTKETLTIEEFAHKLTKEGMSTVLASYPDIYKDTTPKKKYDIEGQEVVALDFDNKEADNTYTINDFKNDEFLNSVGAFWYRTFGDAESEVDKFRVIIRLDEVIKDKLEIEAIYSKLLSIYPQADSTVSYSARLVFGSNRGYDEINFNNRLNVKSFLDGYEKGKSTKKRTKTSAKSNSSAVSVSDSFDTTILTDNSPLWQLLKYKRLDLAKNNLADKLDLSDYVFPNNSSFLNFIDGPQQDMRGLLDLPIEQPFLDIFHDETKPSASVFKSDTTDNWMYKCHSESSEWVGGTFLVIKRLLGVSYLKTIKIMADLLNVKIAEDSNVKQIVDETELLLTVLNSEDLKHTMPNTYKIFGKDLDVITAFFRIINENVFEDFATGTVYLANFYSLERLSQKITLMLKQKVRASRLHKIIITMAIVGMVTKLTDEEIPDWLLHKLNTKKELDGYKYRTDVYLNEGFSDDYEEYLEDISNTLYQGGFRKSSVSYDFFVRLLGPNFEGLSRAYAQKPEKEIGNTSPITDEYLIKAEKYITKWIEKRGYITEKQLNVYLAGTFKVSFEEAKYRLGQLKVDLINNSGFKRVNMNKKLKESLDTEKDKYIKENGYPTIYMKK